MPNQSTLQPRRFIELDISQPLTPDDLFFAQLILKELKDELYHWQSVVLHYLRRGIDVLVRAGTGSGKSYLFQAMMFACENGIVLVIVPTLAIMKDQVRCHWISSYRIS